MPQEGIMTMTQILSPFKLSWKQIVVPFLVVIYIAINIFRTGGDEFVLNLNNNIVHPLAIGVTLFALVLSRQIGGSSRNRLLWRCLFIGWALWTGAKFSLAIASVIGHELPFPSWTCIFWIAGYLPTALALWETLVL